MVTKAELERENTKKWRRKIERDPDSIRHIDPADITPELCNLVIGYSGKYLKFIPEVLRTYELCLMAVKKTGIILKFVPSQHRDLSMCKAAIHKYAHSFSFVPESLKDAELCNWAVSLEGYNIKHVPQHLRTKELCNLAIQTDGNALMYIPDALKTRELCVKAVRDSHYALVGVNFNKNGSFLTARVLDDWNAVFCEMDEIYQGGKDHLDTVLLRNLVVECEKAESISPEIQDQVQQLIEHCQRLSVDIEKLKTALIKTINPVKHSKHQRSTMPSL